MFPYNVCENLWLSKRDKKETKNKSKKKSFRYVDFDSIGFGVGEQHDILTRQHEILPRRLDLVTQLRRKKDFFSAGTLALTYYIIIMLMTMFLVVSLYWMTN
jgi:hypothetical protein